MSATLATIALNAGMPIIEKLLTRKFGDASGQLATEVLGRIAERVGVPADQLDDAAEQDPGRVIDAMRHVNAIAPEVIALHMAALEGQFALLQAETAEGGWKAAWRPAGMYILGFLWLWNVVILHIANAVWKIALPPMPFEQLMQISGLYMGLYMGGHTVKDVAAKWMGK